jgi:hypothetical protein
MTTPKHADEEARAEESANDTYRLFQGEIAKEYSGSRPGSGRCRSSVTRRRLGSRPSSKARSSTRPTSRLQTNSHTSSRS